MLDNIESEYPGYDEYRVNADEIEHDPYVLISILSAWHEGVFTLDEVQSTLEMLFEKQYILTVEEEVQVRYRTETAYLLKPSACALIRSRRLPTGISVVRRNTKSHRRKSFATTMRLAAKYGSAARKSTAISAMTREK